MAVVVVDVCYESAADEVDHSARAPTEAASGRAPYDYSDDDSSTWPDVGCVLAPTAGVVGQQLVPPLGVWR